MKLELACYQCQPVWKSRWLWMGGERKRKSNRLLIRHFQITSSSLLILTLGLCNIAHRNHMIYHPCLLILLHMKKKKEENVICGVMQLFQAEAVIVPDPTAVEATLPQTAIWTPSLRVLAIVSMWREQFLQSQEQCSVHKQVIISGHPSPSSPPSTCEQCCPRPPASLSHSSQVWLKLPSLPAALWSGRRN